MNPWEMQDEPEWQSRRKHINAELAGLPQPWTVVRFSDKLDLPTLTNHAVEEFPTDNGPADYAFFVNGKLLGIMEAKKVSLDPRNVLEQARLHSKGVRDGVGRWENYGVPLLYSTNGERIFFHDIRDGKNLSREVFAYPTPDALNEIIERGSTKLTELSWTSLPEIEQLRPYQREAIKKIEGAIKQGRREMLVAMAAGTGKTAVAVSQIYRLLKVGAFRRILYLVDGKALAAQALREFGNFTTPKGDRFNREFQVYVQKFRKEDFDDHEPFNPQLIPNNYLSSAQPGRTFVYVSTIQRMTVNLFGSHMGFEQDRSDPDYEEDVGQIPIPNHAFDLVIVDECHRGYTANETAVWRDVIQYFDAVKIGLTAAPTPHALTLFKEIVARYTTEEAIHDGWLVDYESYRIDSNVLIDGAFLKEGEPGGTTERFTGRETHDHLDDERPFPMQEIENKIAVTDTTRKIIEQIAKYAYAQEKERGRFPKILIFASNDSGHASHADMIVKICREVFGRGESFVQKITGSPTVDRPLHKIRDFRNRPDPKIVVTVDTLGAGIDVPAIEFVVIIRMVKSRIIWSQMLGRGVRRCDEIGKDHYKIFDCFDGTVINYFKNTNDFKFDPPEKLHLELSKIIENIHQNVDLNYHTNLLIKRLRRVERLIAGSETGDFARFIPDGDLGKFASHLHDSLRNEFDQTMKILDDKDFQGLIMAHHKTKSPFIKAHEAVNELGSERAFSAPGGTVRPEEYLVLFSRFVSKNEGQIDAIRILLDRPKGWKPDALNELRGRLRENSFPEEELQRAHKIVYNKSPADIITMVKHAARQEEPILTSDEHVDRILETLNRVKKFNDEQTKWLGYIRSFLVGNLAIDLRDFDTIPVFYQHGGRQAATRTFPNLEKFVEEINFLMAG